jgi:hypothetical protein
MIGIWNYVVCQKLVFLFKYVIVLLTISLVEDLTKIVVKSVSEIDKVMKMGSKNRTTGRTDMNERSSRSHSVFTITVETSEVMPDGKDLYRVGKLHLVDLAGSEKQSKTGAMVCAFYYRSKELNFVGCQAH